MFLITEITIVIMSALLIWHASEAESPGFAVFFWLGGAWFGLLREWLIANYTHLYTYGDFTLWLFKVPVVYLLFWTNFTYVALRWSENALGEKFFATKSVHNFYPLMFLILVVLGMMVEAYGAQFRMIHWQFDTPLELWGGVPVLIPFSYGLMGMLYLAAFREIWIRVSDPLKRAYHLAAWGPLLVLIHIGGLFIIKVGIDIFSGQLKLH